jgi:hypothetical protein
VVRHWLLSFLSLRRRRGGDDSEGDDRERDRHVDPGGWRQTFWASTSTATTAIHMMLVTPSASNITINPMLEPTQ